ncbi:hypothetical protein Q2452_25660, partial [Escherichia coli]|nr:hypothetical protein [Escherichia coli]
MSNVQNASRSSAFAAVEGDHWVESLDDGRHVLIRPLREEDRERERQFINRLSPATRHFRFLGEIKEAEVASRRGQPVDELAFALPVLLAQGTDQHVAAIVEGLDPMVALYRRERGRPAGILYIGHDAISRKGRKSVQPLPSCLRGLAQLRLIDINAAAAAPAGADARHAA